MIQLRKGIIGSPFECGIGSPDSINHVINWLVNHIFNNVKMTKFRKQINSVNIRKSKHVDRFDVPETEGSKAYLKKKEKHIWITKFPFVCLMCLLLIYLTVERIHKFECNGVYTA